MLHDDVAPVEHRAPAGRYESVDLQQEIEVHPAFPDALAELPAAALSEVESFIASDIEERAFEVREQLVEKPFQESKRAGMGRVKAEGPLAPSAPRPVESLRAFGKTPVPREREP